MSLNAIEFAENPEPRCPCVLLLDTSGSMGGEKIAALNAGLQTFRDDLLQDNLASKRVEVAIVAFDTTVRVEHEFATAEHFKAPTLTAQGLTYTASGINKALDLLQSRKREYKDNGITYYRPWVFLITDGAPYGEEAYVLTQAAQRVKEEETNKRVAFFAVGVEGADMNQLQTMSVRSPIKLKGLSFREMFVWLSASMQRVSHSKPDEQVPLPPPDWMTV
ncbi:VWA domain-containing protein [Pseudanabaena sp. FACHB-1998]|uniref:vWA domain-containing protein n=1 Tax=Pseudanabaena sp. FACHB-1998 TaxID=2692858 RepID=UPI001681A026|nr:VWA domain-containing protein [Pseudanabaena sp. FACHB-1998]MBD2177432.1 VWA domain-containing protein [Pseudanabaena sp. FACHB-1998]